MAVQTPPTFTGEELVRLLALIKESDSVELKLTVPEGRQRSTVLALGMDPLEAQVRQVVFFDTPDLALDAHGVVVRARRVQGKGDDSVVKLRPVVPDQMPEELRRSPAFRVEVDALPGGFVCSATMKGAVRTGAVRSALTSERRVGCSSPASQASGPGFSAGEPLISIIATGALSVWAATAAARAQAPETATTMDTHDASTERFMQFSIGWVPTR
jgi:hypothetical protein